MLVGSDCVLWDVCELFGKHCLLHGHPSAGFFSLQEQNAQLWYAPVTL